MINLENINTYEDFLKESRKLRLYIGIDMLKGYGPSLLNRDADGMEKIVTVGGYPRTMVTSQCLKHAIRHAYGERHSIRTRRMPMLTAMACSDLHEIPMDSAECKTVYLTAAALLDNCTVLDGDEPEAICKQAMFFDDGDFESFSELILANAKAKDKFEEYAAVYDRAIGSAKALKEAIAECAKSDFVKDIKKVAAKVAETRYMGPDRALMGVFSTDEILRTVDSALYMNNAYSIGETQMESDFFSAMEEAVFGNRQMGSAYVDTCSMAAPILYHSMRIDVGQYLVNIFRGIDMSDKTAVKKIYDTAVSRVLEFVRLFALTAPEAKQHPMYTVPRPLALAARISHSPAMLTMDNAFQTPITNDIADTGVRLMLDFLGDNDWGDSDARKLWISKVKSSDAKIENVTLDGLLDVVREEIANECN